MNQQPQGAKSPDEGQLAVDIIKEWKTNPKVRAEFCNSLASYAAYRKAEAAGSVRVR